MIFFREFSPQVSSLFTYHYPYDAMDTVQRLHIDRSALSAVSGRSWLRFYAFTRAYLSEVLYIPIMIMKKNLQH